MWNKYEICCPQNLVLHGMSLPITGFEIANWIKYIMRKYYALWNVLLCLSYFIQMKFMRGDMLLR